MSSRPAASDETAFLIDIGSGEAGAMTEITLAQLGLKERGDLQRWISLHPEIVGRDLLLVTTEFDQWEIRDQKVPDRLDVLFIDSDGSPLVAELKRDRAGDTTELQALKYAAYCSQLTLEDLVEEFSRYHQTDATEARARLIDHAPALETDEPGPIRIRLVAGSFGPAVTSVVLWLRDNDIDIGCIQVTARLVDGERAILSARPLLPLPQAEDYLVRRRRREQEEEQTKRKRRSINSVPMLDQAGVVQPGHVLHLKLDQFTSDWQPKVEALLQSDPKLGEAEWTGLGVQKALRSRADGELYSCTGLVKAILSKVGIDYASIAGPDYWLLPNGRSIYEESKIVEAELGQDLVGP